MPKKSQVFGLYFWGVGPLCLFYGELTEKAMSKSAFGLIVNFADAIIMCHTHILADFFSVFGWYVVSLLALE